MLKTDPAERILDTLIACGATVSTDGTKVQVRGCPKSKLPPGFVDELAQRRGEVILRIRARQRETGETWLGGDPSPLARWRREVARFAERAPGHHGMALVDAALAFLAGPFAPRAVAMGWSALELFGVHERAARARYDAQGRVPGLAWSVLGLRLIALSRHAARLQTYTGARLTHRRQRTCAPGEAVPFWDCEDLLAKSPRRATARSSASRA